MRNLFQISPTEEPSYLELEHFIYAASLAASADNNQPWRFKTVGSKLLLYYEKSAAITSDRDHLFNFLSFGMALENIRLAASDHGYFAEIEYFPDKKNQDLIAEVCFRGRAKADPLYHHALKRRTGRSAHFKKEIPAAVLTELQAQLNDSNSEVHFVERRSHIKLLAKLFAKFDCLRFALPSFHKELYKHLKFDEKALKEMPIGLNVDDLALPPGAKTLLKIVKSRTLLFCLRLLGFDFMLRFLSQMQLAKTQAFGLITCQKDDPTSLIKAGHSLQRLWAIAEREGLLIHPLGSLPIFSRYAERCTEIEKLLPFLKGKSLLLCFRIGFGKRVTSQRYRLAPSELKVENENEAVEGGFTHSQAFSRSIGLVTPRELEILKHKTIAIPGMGGVGGIHLATLCRMGVGGFHIGDADTFSVSNFNRQYGATVSNIGKNKTEVMAKIAKEINPELRLREWHEGINESNVEDFLNGCDLVVDSLDAFALKARRMVFNAALKKGIPVISAGPLGFSTSMIIFLPNGMTFDTYFNYSEKRETADNFVDFLLGVAPRPHFLSYMDSKRVSGSEKHGPSSAAAVHLCAGFAAVEALKILLGKGKVRAVPHYHYFDPYLMKFKIGYTPLGGKNPLRRLVYHLVRKKLRLDKIRE